MAEFRMPSLGADMEAGTVYEWHVKPGDRVKRGDIIGSVETDKGVIDLELFEDGIISQILVAVGTRMPVGAVLALIQTEEETVKAVPEVMRAAAVPLPLAPQPSMRPPELPAPPPGNGYGRVRVSPVARKRAAALGLDLSQVKGSGPGGVISLDDVEQAAKAQEIKATPVARRAAADLGVDLSQLQGTGPHGAINRADVERAAEAAQPVTPPTPTPKPPADKAAPDFQAGIRRAIAAAMSRSNRDIPHYYLETRIDMTTILRWLEAENQQRSLKDRLLPVVLLIRATAKALSDVPELNGYWLDDQFQPQEAIHLGFAVALRQGGLVTPAIHHADLKSLDELMADMRDLITRTRSGRLRSSELTDATVTLTSLGDRGAEKVYGVIYPPQVALVGFGKIAEQPWAENGMLGVRQVVTATLAADHRASDGHRGGLFLEALNRHLQETP